MRFFTYLRYWEQLWEIDMRPWEKIAIGVAIALFGWTQFYYFMDQARRDGDQYLVGLRFSSLITDEVDGNFGRLVAFEAQLKSGSRSHFVYDDQTYSALLQSGNLNALGERIYEVSSFYRGLKSLADMTGGNTEDDQSGSTLKKTQDLEIQYKAALQKVDGSSLDRQFDSINDDFDHADNMLKIVLVSELSVIGLWMYANWKSEIPSILRSMRGFFVRIKKSTKTKRSPNKSTSRLHDDKGKDN